MFRDIPSMESTMAADSAPRKSYEGDGRPWRPDQEFDAQVSLCVCVNMKGWLVITIV